MTIPTPPVRAELIREAKRLRANVIADDGSALYAAMIWAVSCAERLADELERQPDAGEGWETPPWRWAKDEPTISEPGGIDHGDMIEVMLHGGTTVVGNLKSIINWRGGWMAWRRVEAYRLVAAKAQDEGRFRLYREGHQPKPPPPGDGGDHIPDAGKMVEPSPADVAIRALEAADEALREYACFTPVAPCVRPPDQCANGCGKAAGEALITVREALSKLRGG